MILGRSGWILERTNELIFLKKESKTGREGGKKWRNKEGRRKEVREKWKGRKCVGKKGNI